VHYTDARVAHPPRDVVAELAAHLAAAGLTDVAITAPIAAGIEDVFMALMGDAPAVAA
jgi:hypothetical protein